MELKEAINCLENMISDYVISAYCEECSNHDNCTEDCYFRTAIDTVLSELDKQKQIKADMRKVAFEEGYIQGFNKCREKIMYMEVE